MTEFILQTDHITKSYHGIRALEDICLSLEKGRIYGLIGENGAGKTTLMRLITGLVFPDSGVVKLFGQEGQSELIQARRRIGSLIEAPAYYPSMTAQENLEMYRIMKGIPDKSCVQKALAMTGLEKSSKRVKHFSMGMRQRLGIGAALLGSPELLVLDEPINGLDPKGIAEVRELLGRLSREYHVTVLLSSHILQELYQLCTDYVMIHRGRILEKLTLEGLDEKCGQFLLIKVDDPQKTAVVLEQLLHASRFRIMPDGSVRLYGFLERREEVARTLQEQGILVTGFSVKGESLEQYYLHLIGGEQDV